jgi:outer membrane protein assembly factor BamD (BamD/ComL family)
MKTIINAIVIICLLIFLFGCASTRKYEAAKETNTISAYENYLQQYPNNKYTDDINIILQRLYEERDWNRTLRFNTIASYNEFILKYPASSNVTTAYQKINEINEKRDWENAAILNSINAFENFIETYPKSKHIFEAKNKLITLKENFAWENAVRIGSVNSYKDFIDKFPYSSKVSNAIEKIKEIESILPLWNKAMLSKEKDDFKTLISQFPHNPYAKLAEFELKKIDDEAWKETTAINTIKSYQDYLSDFDDGKYVNEAKKRIIDIEVDEILKGNHGKLPPMDKSYDNRSFANNNTIEIYNNTTYTLTVWYSGPQSLKVIIPKKQRKSITLPNGDYRVAASVNARDINNYAGNEKLEGGEYSVDYYIKTTHN